MPISRFVDLAYQADRMGVICLSIQGGEPLLWFNHLKRFLKDIPTKRFLVSLKTNGTLLNREKLLELKVLGVDILTVSLDSGIPQEHDGFRGKQGAHELSIAGIELALQLGFVIIIASTVSRRNLRGEGLRKLIEWTAQKKIRLLLIKAAATGRWENSADILLRESDCIYYDSLLERNPHCFSDLSANLFGTGCGAGNEIIYVKANGVSSMCPFIDISIGDNNKESLALIWNRVHSNPMLKVYPHKCLVGDPGPFRDRYIMRSKKDTLISIFQSPSQTLHEGTGPNGFREK